MFSMKSSYVFIPLPPPQPCSFFFSAFLSFYEFICSYKSLDLGMTELTSSFMSVAIKGLSCGIPGLYD